MKMDHFKLRHAALVTALALAMGVPPAFADEALPEAPVLQPAADVPSAAADEPLVTVEPGDVGAVTPVETPVAVEEPAPVDDVGVVGDGATGEVTVQGEEPLAEPVAVEDAVPVDECGMMCWNVADIPPEAVQKGGEEVDPQILQFEAPEPTLNVSAELSGAVGVSEQLGAGAADLDDATSVEALNTDVDAPAVVTTANAGAVNVIRDGHLR